MIPSQELKAPYWPYSPVVINLVKMGVVMEEIPFCKKEQIRNQKEARTCTDIF
jgi:hypothetical protein